MRDKNYKLVVQDRIIAILSSGLLLVGLLLFFILYKNKKIRTKNRYLAAMLKELNETKMNPVYRQNPVAEPVHATDGGGESAAPEDKEAFAPVFTLRRQTDKEIFEDLLARIKEQQYFLDYQLGREFYMELTGLNKNHFANLLKEQAGTNLSGLLNNLRLDYAVMLIRTRSDLKLKEIGTMSAIPNASTFFRLFKEKYGISPKDFRTSLEQQEEEHIKLRIKSEE